MFIVSIWPNTVDMSLDMLFSARNEAAIEAIRWRKRGYTVTVYFKYNNGALETTTL